MTSCEQTQSQLLAYMYDLLEETDRQELQAHLETCNDCKAALARAQNQKRLLALAAKAEFPKVHFHAPVEEIPQQPATIAPPRSWGAYARRWAIAASITLLVGLGIPSGWWTVNYLQDKSRATVEQEHLMAVRAEEQVAGLLFQDKIARASSSREKVEKEIEDLDKQRNTKLVALEKQVEQRQFDVQIRGPANYQPGAP